MFSPRRRWNGTSTTALLSRKNSPISSQVRRCLSPSELITHYQQSFVGFDIAGHEDVLHPLSYYLKELLAFKERQKEAGLDIPFLFHAGETLGDGTEADMNLYDAILLGTKRIGHGFSITKHPKLLQLCRERGIAIEICPISYVLLPFPYSYMSFDFNTSTRNEILVSPFTLKHLCFASDARRVHSDLQDQCQCTLCRS